MIFDFCYHWRIIKKVNNNLCHNLALGAEGGELLVVSQFTLLADTRKGRRPSFTNAAPPEEAERLFEEYVRQVAASGLPVATGRFQQYMLVEIHNDGPVTLMLDSRERPA